MRRFRRHGLLGRLASASVLAASVLVPVTASLSAAPSAQAAVSLPCDIYATGGTPCVAAYSTTRALFAAYSGPLYQIQRSSDKSYLDVGVAAAGGYANASAQVSFCSGTTCTITKLYDQSSEHNDLPISWIQSDVGADAMALPVTVNGNAVYGVKVLNTSAGAVGYRDFSTQGVPTGSQPEGIYEVTSTALYNSSCCFDFGSAENGWRDDGDGTMNAIEFGSACWFGGCTGSGPWVEADLEQGMYSSITGPNNASNPGITYPFVTAWEKNNGTSNFTLKYGNANGGSLTTTYSGALPSGGYSPMRLENSVLLGTGGGNDHGDTGEFFEGAVTSGFPSDATENAVQSELASVGYAAVAAPPQVFPSGYHRLVVGNDSLCLDSYGNTSNAGAAIDQYTCNGQANQQLQFVPTSGGYGELQVENSGQDVSVANSSTSQGVADIVQEPVNGNAASQWLPSQQSDGSWQFKNKNSGLCLDVFGAGSNNGQQLDQWPCKNAPGTNQDFTPH
ncbi:arabinofuranosidase catalytic domain-containing protein [Actinospica robiniae]|uniref:arabinofuranosidase catalytic domain-containing protein n=1 Tax=Actinospica robiniae TaxID=304901 RepID=UPI00055522AC|nr:arabinofuranosidase catalytic domain-containing protein [Actinospica robiniae]